MNVIVDSYYQLSKIEFLMFSKEWDEKPPALEDIQIDLLGVNGEIENTYFYKCRFVDGKWRIITV